MPQTEIAKKHHFIPEFYLKRWASKGQVVEFQRHYGGVVKAKPKHPAATGYTKMGYALSGFPPETASALEELYFKPVDMRAAEALLKIEAGTAQLTGAERVAWGQFLLSLVHRQPERIKQMRRNYEALTLQISKADQRRWRRERRPSDPKLFAEAMRTTWTQDADRLQRQALQLTTNAISSDLIGGHLVNMQWGLLTLPPDAGALMTSDHPVQWYRPMSDDQCHILLPIGPKSVFWAVNTQEMALLISSRPAAQMVKFLNEHTVRRAVTYVYSMSESHLAYVQEHMGVDPQPNNGDAGYERPTPKRLNAMRRQAARAHKATRCEKR